nr:hypothetical protein [Candidatus Paceibacterota bacterium]
EELSLEIKKQLAEFLFCKLGASYETAFSVMGVNINDEFQKRTDENAKNYSDVFMPHPTSFNVSDSADKANPDNNIGGRPKGDETNKQIYDKTNNDAKSDT